MKNNKLINAPIKGAVALAALLMGSIAEAHTGFNHSHSLADGFTHPFTGIDHMAAMLAVGLWAAQMGGRAVWAVPASFMAMLTAGAALAMAGVTVPAVESGVVASVLVLGLLVARAARLSLAFSAVCVGVFALMHGQAHAIEMPLLNSGLSYTAGFVAASLMLHIAGVRLAGVMSRYFSPRSVQMLGGAVAVAGAYLSLN